MITTALAPSPTQQAVNKIDSILAGLVQRDGQIIKTLEGLLMNAKAGGKPIKTTDIIEASGGRYANLQAYIDHMKAGINMLAPDTFPKA